MEMSNNCMASRSSSTRRRPTVISDEERREVAKRLRNGGIARNSEEAYVLLLSRIGIRPQLPAVSTYEDAMVRLADLIDRPTCRNLGLEEGTNGEGYDFFCSRCGFADDVVDPKYCPECGAEVVE